MPEKSPIAIEMITYGWVIILSLWGGMASYARKIRGGVRVRFSLIELIGDLVISGFSGLMTFYLCQSAEIDILVTAVFIGISGHMGSRVIFLMEELFDKQLRQILARINAQSELSAGTDYVPRAFDIKLIQQALNEQREEPDIVENGSMDEMTIRAIMEFQIVKNIYGDGLLGPKTLALLGVSERRIN